MHHPCDGTRAFAINPFGAPALRGFRQGQPQKTGCGPVQDEVKTNRSRDHVPQGAYRDRPQRLDPPKVHAVVAAATDHAATINRELSILASYRLAPIFRLFPSTPGAAFVTIVDGRVTPRNDDRQRNPVPIELVLAECQGQTIGWAGRRGGRKTPANTPFVDDVPPGSGRAR